MNNNVNMININSALQIKSWCFSPTTVFPAWQRHEVVEADVYIIPKKKTHV
jgi:hypothetical protein